MIIFEKITNYNYEFNDVIKINQNLIKKKKKN